jgi:hypothetical protein
MGGPQSLYGCGQRSLQQAAKFSGIGGAICGFGSQTSSQNRDGRYHRHIVDAQRLAEMLQAEPFEDPQAARDLRIVREQLSGQAGPTTIPELKLAVLRDGAETSLDKYARPPSVGEELRVSWTSRSGETDYVLVLGGQGRASLLMRACCWRESRLLGLKTSHCDVPNKSPTAPLIGTSPS